MPPLRRSQILPRHLARDDLRTGVTEQVQERVVGFEDAAVEVAHDDADDSRLRDLREARAGLGPALRRLLRGNLRISCRLQGERIAQGQSCVLG